MKLVSESSIAQKILNSKNDSHPKAKSCLAIRMPLVKMQLTFKQAYNLLGKVGEQRKKKVSQRIIPVVL